MTSFRRLREERTTKQALCSVPQDSVLGLSMFILYMVELAALASKFGVNLYAFADDNQLHVHCDISDIFRQSMLWKSALPRSANGCQPIG